MAASRSAVKGTAQWHPLPTIPHHYGYRTVMTGACTRRVGRRGWRLSDHAARAPHCTILTIRSNSPRTAFKFSVAAGQIPRPGTSIFRPQSSEIDHLVPLFYAWGRGANRWEAETQRRFANDSANLLPVEAMANRSKGAAGPDERLPPSEAFACEYLLRFDRVTDRYDLDLRPEEAIALEQLIAQKCD